MGMDERQKTVRGDHHGRPPFRRYDSRGSKEGKALKTRLDEEMELPYLPHKLLEQMQKECK